MVNIPYVTWILWVMANSSTKSVTSPCQIQQMVLETPSQLNVEADWSGDSDSTHCRRPDRTLTGSPTVKGKLGKIIDSKLILKRGIC